MYPKIKTEMYKNQLRVRGKKEIKLANCCPTHTCGTCRKVLLLERQQLILQHASAWQGNQLPSTFEAVSLPHPQQKAPKTKTTPVEHAKN